MAFLKAFGSYVPERLWHCPTPLRRGRPGRCGNGVAAEQDCLCRAGMQASDLGMVIVSSGSAEYFAAQPMTAKPVVFAAFGAGFHWGAVLVESRAA